MKFIKSNALEKRINELIDVNDLNMSLSEIYLAMLGKYDDAIIQKLQNSKNQKSDFLKIIADCLEIDLSNDEDNKIWNERIAPSLHLVDENQYKNNDYYKNIIFKNINFGKYSLKTDSYDPFEIFPLNDIKVNNDYIELTSLGYFTKSYQFYALNDRDVTWMSINPNEIETMKEAIDQVSGSVLVYGLGLGYFPYMISLKKDVNKIVIVENDLNIIRLFKENILPQFNNVNKIEIVYINAHDFKPQQYKFDYAFVDLWHSADDGIKTYLKFKKNECKNIKYLYWLEDSFYALLRRAFITLISEQYFEENESKYNVENNTFDWLINTYYRKTKNITISNCDDLDNLLQNNSLLNLIIS